MYENYFTEYENFPQHNTTYSTTLYSQILLRGLNFVDLIFLIFADFSTQQKLDPIPYTHATQ